MADARRLTAGTALGIRAQWAEQAGGPERDPSYQIALQSIRAP